MFARRFCQALICLIICVLPLFASAIHVNAIEGVGGGHVTVPAPSDLRVQLLDYQVGPPSGQQLNSTINLTLTSAKVTSVYVDLRLRINDPQGLMVFDNFYAEGSSADPKNTLVSNGTISQVRFATTLPPLVSGYYTFMATAYSPDLTTVYDTTTWLPAFLITSSNIALYDLGPIQHDSLVSRTPNVSLKQFQSATFTLVTSSPMGFLRFTLQASTGSRLSLTLNSSDSGAETQLRFDTNVASWTVSNIPASEYRLLVSSLAQVTSLSFVEVQAGPLLTLPSVTIISVSPTAQSATPGGNINFHVVVKWDITSKDTLQVGARLSGTEEKQTLSVEPLAANSNDLYLTIGVPSISGRYTASISASLQNAGVTTSAQTSFDVRSNNFNIAVLDKVQYYKDPPFWMFWASRSFYNDSSQLSALDVQNIRVTNVDAYDDQGRPSKVGVAFSAHNKQSTEILPFVSLGAAVHYEVKIKFGTSSPIPLAAVLAGETEEVAAENIPVVNGKVQFTIIYSIWVLGEIVEVGASVLDAVVSTYAAAVRTARGIGDIINVVKDIARLSLLYLLKFTIFRHQGYLTEQDVKDIAQNLPDIFVDAFSNSESVNNNVFLSVLGALVDLLAKGKIDLGRFLYAAVGVIVLVFVRAGNEAAEPLWEAVDEAFGRFGVSIDGVGQKITEQKAKDILAYVKSALSIADLLATLWRLLTAPTEEGKIIGASASVAPAIRLDPTAHIMFSGPVQNTSLRFFSPIGVSANISSMSAQISIEADQNMTSFYLAPLSDSLFRHELYAGFGFNETSSDLDWKVMSNQFLLTATGEIFPGIQTSNFLLNKTWVQGTQSISFDAESLGGNRFVINQTLTYPLGKNLTTYIRIELPPGSTNIKVLAPGYQISGTTVTWTTSMDQIVIQFDIVQTVSNRPCALWDFLCPLGLLVWGGMASLAVAATLVTLRRKSRKRTAKLT